MSEKSATGFHSPGYKALRFIMLIFLLGIILWNLGFFGGSSECRYKDRVFDDRFSMTSSFSHIKPIPPSMYMKRDGTLIFSIMKGAAGYPANITNLTVIYLGERCQREVVCPVKEFQDKIKMEPGEVIEVHTHCPDVHKEEGTKVYVYIRTAYEALDAKGRKHSQDEDGLAIFPVSDTLVV